MLKESVNEEELLDLALFRISREEDSVALQIIVAYVMENLLDTVGLDDEELESLVAEEVNKLIVDYSITELTKKGVLEVDFSDDEPRFSLTDLGLASNEYQNPE